MITKKSEWNFDKSLVERDTYSIISKYGLRDGQLSLTHREKDKSLTDKLYAGVGSLYDTTNKRYRSLENEFSVFNDVFKDTYLYQMYKDIGNVGRMRIMSMQGPKTYTVHRDFNIRYHFVVHTNPHCFFVFPDLNQICRIPNNGYVYEVDTTQYHTFVNGSRENRIHIVMDDISGYG